MFKDKLVELITNNYGKTIGSLIGLVTSILLFTIGFFKTILLISLVSLGYYIGNKIDKRESITDILDKILPHANIK